MKTLARFITEGPIKISKLEDQTCKQVIRHLFDSAKPQILNFLRSLGLKPTELPELQVSRAAEKSDIEPTPRRLWYKATVESTQVESSIEVAFLYDPALKEICAVSYRLNAGAGVPAFQLLSRTDEWLYSETVTGRYGDPVEPETLEKAARALDRAIKNDVKEFRHQVSTALSESKHDILKLIRVGEYRL